MMPGKKLCAVVEGGRFVYSKVDFPPTFLFNDEDNLCMHEC